MNESVKAWLDRFTIYPSAEIHKLIFGYAGVAAWSKTGLYEIFNEISNTHSELLDITIEEWLQKYLMKPHPENISILVWTSSLENLFRSVSGQCFKKVEKLLRDEILKFRSWLRPLRKSQNLDPEAAYLCALAWSEQNQGLEKMWNELILCSDNEPLYYSDVGQLGIQLDIFHRRKREEMLKDVL